MAEQYLKVLSAENQSCHGGAFDWTPYLPTADGPGKLLPEIEGPKICSSGYHWTTEAGLMQHWARAHMRVYVAEPSADVTAPDNDGKSVSSGGRLVSEYALPQWWQDAMRFIREEIPATEWFRSDGEPLPEWRVFPTRDAARGAALEAAWGAALEAAWDAARGAALEAAWDAARGAAGGAAWDAARGAALYAHCVYICEGTDLAEEHRQHARDRWEVWRKGYGLLRVVAGVSYVYKAVS